MPLNFSDALANIKKKAQLEGRPLSQQEVSGVAEGYSENASQRLTRQRALELDKQKHDETLAQQKSQFEATMAQNKKDREAAKEASNQQTGASAGAALGTVIGTAVGGPWGAPVGAILGSIIGKQCIIISACTSRDSYEVNVARLFRDKYMSQYHLGGYYALAHRFVPIMEKSNFLKLITKRFLVDRLVDYGEWVFGLKPKRQLRTSRIITEGFLSVCAAIGMRINVQPFIEAHR